MSGTRSHSRTAPATERHALIVAHGSPSAPAGQEAIIAALAARVAGSMPGWTVRGTTLAMPGALERSIEGLVDPLVYPFFMAPGWFVDCCLPARLGPRAGACLAPPGADPGLPGLIADMVQHTIAAHGWTTRETTLVLAAHGNPKRPESAQAARSMAAALESRLHPYALRLGFLDEPPFLAAAARVRSPALCVPLFATSAGHVTRDIPRALSDARFAGPVLPPLIHYRGIDRLIANALLRHGMERNVA